MTHVCVPGKIRLVQCVAAILWMVVGASASAAQQPSSLIQAWLALPDASNIAWPYAYVRAGATQESQEGARRDLFAEYGRLSWRLSDDGYENLVNTLKAWKARLSSIDTFREPGDWSPAFLMSHVNQNPPISSVAAIGACDVPSTVTVWDSSGVHEINWQSGMALSDIEKTKPATRQGSAPEISVVDPYGNIDHYGVQAWNYADGPVAPGSHVVASLPLKGSAFTWIRDVMAGLLAHTPSGFDCRERRFSPEGQADE